MRRAKVIFLAFIATLFVCHSASGQYYETGQSPASQKWRYIRTDSLKVIFPREYEVSARKTLHYMETVRPYVDYGFRFGPMKTPVVFKTENFASNGLAMLAPRRIELIAVPDMMSYSEPWLKQLAVHEYRHMVQFRNINRSTIKVLGYIIGQQAALLGTGLIPFWFIEGDAVMTETQMSQFGRALQPSFNMHYRAIGREVLDKRNPDKWFSGSYKDYVPSHYEVGYQIVRYAQSKYGKFIWDDVYRYSANYPFLVFTTQLALGKYYDTSTRKLFSETFGVLNDFWDSLPAQDNSASIISQPVKRYTTYSYPQFADLGGELILALKSDFDRYSRFVLVDAASGEERHVAHTGVVSSRPALHDGSVYWTEYRQSLLWDQKIDSRIYRMSLADGKTERYGRECQALYVTPLGADSIAYVKYNYEGNYSVIWSGGQTDFDSGISLHGLAYDGAEDRLYFIGLSDDGMWLGGINMDDSSVANLTKPAHVTLSDLRAANGSLYFGSVRSGRDEVHRYDIAQGKEYRVTTSDLGSFAAAPSADGRMLALTVYDKKGYLLAEQAVADFEEVAYASVPENVVNPQFERWSETMPMDSLRFTNEELERSERKYESKRYRRALNLFGVHSWAPAYYDPEALIGGDVLNTRFGATVISQNELGSAVSSLGYGYLGDGNSIVRAKFGYYGWAPKIEVTASWRDYAPSVGIYNYVNVSANIYMPLLLSSGYRVRFLTPNVQYVYRNGGSARHTLYGSLQYSESVRKARLDIQPRWGYLLRASVMSLPGNNANAISAYGRAYLPGFAKHHAITLNACYQQTINTNTAMTVIDFLPRGFDNMYVANFAGASVNYELPVAYPDWGLSGIFFLKRIRLKASFDYAGYTAGDSSRRSIYSYGGTLSLDFAPFRMPHQSTSTLAASLFFPRGLDPFFSLGMTFPL